MPASALQYLITDVFGEIQADESEKEMAQTLQHRLLPLIEGNTVLAQEWDRRVVNYPVSRYCAAVLNTGLFA